MNYQNFRYAVLSVVVGLLFSLPLTITTEAFAVGMVEIEAPSEVGIGQPFLVRISSRYTLDDLTVTWQGREVKPEVAEADYDYSAIVILGTGLKSEPGFGDLKVSATLWGHFRRFEKRLKIVPVDYKKETLTVAPKMVKPSEESLKRIAEERKLIKAALQTQSPKRMWDLQFTRPAKGKMLSRFGLHRVFNGHTKARHTGLDFRAWLGTPLYSMAPGKVILTGHFYYAGNCAFVDHGNGLISLYCHMSKLLVKEGDVVESGQKVGLSGATGRVTGAHLHLAVFAQGEVIDPEPLVTNSLVQKE